MKTVDGKSPISRFDNEKEIIATISQIVHTLPSEIQADLNFQLAPVQTMEIYGADTRRPDIVFTAHSRVNPKTYGVEMKRGILQSHHIYEALFERRYVHALKASHGNEFVGMLFVGETIEDKIKNNSPSHIIPTLAEAVDSNVHTLALPLFARTVVSKSISGILEEPERYKICTVTQLKLQLEALTTASDGYPEWFNQRWLRDIMRTLKPVWDSQI